MDDLESVSVLPPLTITLPAFPDGGWIPDAYTGRGADRSPEIRLSNLCEGAVSLAVILDDASHPLFPNYNHWVIWNLPVSDVIPAGIPAGERVEALGGAVQGVAYGKHRYRGPKPPFRWTHTYVFTVYVLDTALNLPASSIREDVFMAMDEHVLQEAKYHGKYQSHRKPAESA